MRILFLAHRLPYPPNKGDKIRSFGELEALARHHEVDLFCFYNQPEDSQYFPDVRRYCRDLYAEKISWLRSRAQASLACAFARPFTTAFYRSPTMARRIREAMAKRKYDLIFVFSSSMARYVESAPQPRVLDMVDIDSDKWTQYADHAPLPVSSLWRAEGRRLAKDEARWARTFSMTLLCTSAEAEILRRNAPGAKIEALENRMDTNHFDPNKVEVPAEIATWQPYIIFTGSMDYFPNVDAATFFYREVFAVIRAELPKARFVIAGRNPKRAVCQLARDPAVRVTGAVADIRPYLRGASAAVAPLRVARGVQNKIFEAMAMGLPLVSSSKAAMALPESLLSQVYVEDDPQRVASFLIDSLRQSPSPREEIRRAVLGHFDGLRWEEQLERILAGVARSRDETKETAMS